MRLPSTLTKLNLTLIQTSAYDYKKNVTQYNSNSDCICKSSNLNTLDGAVQFAWLVQLEIFQTNWQRREQFCNGHSGALLPRAGTATD